MFAQLYRYLNRKYKYRFSSSSMGGSVDFGTGRNFETQKMKFAKQDILWTSYIFKSGRNPLGMRNELNFFEFLNF